MNCEPECFEATIEECPDEIKIKGGFSAATVFKVVITNQYGKEFFIPANSDADGILVIPTASLGDGTLNRYAGFFSIMVLDSNGSRVEIKINDVEWDCVMFQAVEIADASADPHNIIQ